MLRVVMLTVSALSEMTAKHDDSSDDSNNNADTVAVPDACSCYPNCQYHYY